jgi:hypothetical protein
MPYCAQGHNRTGEAAWSGVRRTLRNGSVGRRGDSGLRAEATAHGYSFFTQPY